MLSIQSTLFKTHLQRSPPALLATPPTPILYYILDEMSSTASSAPGASNSDSNSNDDNSNPTSSPLLFFVALGFGVVFTNLWYAWLYTPHVTTDIDDESQDYCWCEILF